MHGLTYYLKFYIMEIANIKQGKVDRIVNTKKKGNEVATTCIEININPNIVIGQSHIKAISDLVALFGKDAKIKVTGMNFDPETK